MTEPEAAQHYVKVIEGGGDVIVIVPPVFNVPGNTFVPPSGRLMGVRDARTGELFPGVIGLKLKASADAADSEVTVKLREIAVPVAGRPGVGRPIRTADDIREAAKAHRGKDALPWVSTIYRVAGFELGTVPSPTFDPVDFTRDVDELRRALGIEGEDEDG